MDQQTSRNSFKTAEIGHSQEKAQTHESTMNNAIQTGRMKIALISDVPPDPKYTAGQVLERILEHTSFIKTDFYWLNQSSLDSPKLSSHVTLKKEYRFNSSPVILKYFPKILTRIDNCLRSFTTPIRAIFLGFNLGMKLRKSNYEYLWLIVQGENLVLIHFFIAFLSNKKIILHQWDPLEWWMEHRNHNEITKRIMKKFLTKIEKASSSNIVPSHAWNEMQINRGLKSLRVDLFFSNDEIKRFNTPSKKVSPPNELNAVFLGQLYANQELMKLIDKIYSECLKNNIKLKIHYFGLTEASLNNKDIELIAHGYLSRNELIESIRNFDVGLLPYPIEERFNTTSTFSFPSKSRVYLAAGLPIISYSKTDSSPNRFFTKYYGDYYLNTYDHKEIKDFVLRLVNSTDEDRNLASIKSRTIIAANFSQDSELLPFHKFLKRACD